LDFDYSDDDRRRNDNFSNNNSPLRPSSSKRESFSSRATRLSGINGINAGERELMAYDGSSALTFDEVERETFSVQASLLPSDGGMH
jgi:hypothetical protein